MLSIHFDLCVDATGVVFHQLGLLGTDLQNSAWVVGRERDTHTHRTDKQTNRSREIQVERVCVLDFFVDFTILLRHFIYQGHVFLYTEKRC